jgi:DNA polymerase
MDTLLTKPVAQIPDGNLAALRRKSRDCHACPLWKRATQTVFGEGPARAEVMLIGEQPGLQEDREGLPFVGPAGGMLDRALAEAGLDRKTLFLTNTVKHFKYETRGTAKLHKRANAAEQAACRMWLAAELARVQP